MVGRKLQRSSYAFRLQVNAEHLERGFPRWATSWETRSHWCRLEVSYMQVGHTPLDIEQKVEELCIISNKRSYWACVFLKAKVRTFFYMCEWEGERRGAMCEENGVEKRLDSVDCAPWLGCGRWVENALRLQSNGVNLLTDLQNRIIIHHITGKISDRLLTGLAWRCISPASWPKAAPLGHLYTAGRLRWDWPIARKLSEDEGPPF